MIASIGPVSTLIGVSIRWLPFNILLGGDLALNHLLKPLLTRSLFVDVSFLLRIYMNLYVILFGLTLIFFFFFFLFFLGMETMKENKGKEVVDEGNRLETQSQPRPSAGDKRKALSKNLDSGNLPSRRGKKAKYGSSKAGVVKPSLPMSQPSVQIFDVDSSAPVEITPSKTTAPASSQPSQRIPMNLIENEDLTWERFDKTVSNEDIAACYDMSLKDFEHSGVHDLFKVCNFIFALSLSLYIFLV